MLSQEEFNKEYFEGNHPAGYGAYQRHYIQDMDSPDDKGEVRKSVHGRLFEQFKEHLADKKCLDIGCAKGFLVEDFREFGIECFGVDWSEYAIGQSPVPEHLKLVGAHEYIKQLPDGAFDVATLIRFMPCLADNIIPEFLNELRRISKFQIFVVDDKEYYSQADFGKLQQYYNVKGFDNWLQLLETDTSHVESITDKKWDGYR